MDTHHHARPALYSLTGLLAIDLLAALALVMDQWLEVGRIQAWLLAAPPVLLLLPLLSTLARAAMAGDRPTASRSRESKSHNRDNPVSDFAPNHQGPHHAHP